ncbi:MAG: hypothetical protein HF967_06890 [Methanosarcinales archaeon]|nr:hypothetical protein [Methanosarcinales archaeon]
MYANNKNKESMGLENLTINSSETKKLGKLFSQDILKYSSKKQAVIIGLEGNLGRKIAKTLHQVPFTC